jgi:acyl-CoA reductase-like NAD-dependent aldehyde dehydrogenase
VKNDTQIAQDEMFGPIAPIIRVDGEAEALRVANLTEFGLSSAVFTRNQARGLRFALGVEAGMTNINNHSVDERRPVRSGVKRTADSAGSAVSGSSANSPGTTGSLPSMLDVAIH